MEAYKVKYNTKVIVLDKDIQVPVGSLLVNTGDTITILNTDGMYCKVIKESTEVTFIAAWTEVKEI